MRGPAHSLTIALSSRPAAPPRSAFNWTSRRQETPYSRPTSSSVVGGGSTPTGSGRRSLDLVALSSRSLHTSASAAAPEAANLGPRALPPLNYEPSLRALQPPLLSPSHEDARGTIEQRRYVALREDLPPRRQLPLLANASDLSLHGAAQVFCGSLGWRAEPEADNDVAFSVSERAWDAAPSQLALLQSPARRLPPRLSDRQETTLHTFDLRPPADASGAPFDLWQPSEAEPPFAMQRLLMQRGMALSDPPPPSRFSSPRVSWQSPTLSVGLQLSPAQPARSQGRTGGGRVDLGASPPRLSVGAAAPAASCRSSLVASRSPSASGSPPSPQPLGFLGGGLRAASRDSPLLRTGREADATPRTGGHHAVAAAPSCAGLSSSEPPASHDAPLASPSADPGADPSAAEPPARGEAAEGGEAPEALQEYGSFMPAATSTPLASPCPDRPQEAEEARPACHDKRTQTAPPIGLTSSRGTQTSPQAER